jgi:hypothetical protein
MFTYGLYPVVITYKSMWSYFVKNCYYKFIKPNEMCGICVIY